MADSPRRGRSLARDATPLLHMIQHRGTPRRARRGESVVDLHNSTYSVALLTLRLHLGWVRSEIRADLDLVTAAEGVLSAETDEDRGDPLPPVVPPPLPTRPVLQTLAN